jgi:hypothetical protein
MKEFMNSVAQLAAIIMILITLAITTAAVSQWASADGSVASTPATEKAQTALASSSSTVR